MVRASDCGPEGRRFDPAIPPHAKVPARVHRGWNRRSVPRGKRRFDPAIPPHLRLKSPISAFFLARSMTNRASLGENTDLKDFIT